MYTETETLPSWVSQFTKLELLYVSAIDFSTDSDTKAKYSQLFLLDLMGFFYGVDKSKASATFPVC